MKRTRLFLLALVPAIMIFCAVPSQAQAPEGQLGIQAGTHGLGIQYAVSPSIHAGLLLGLSQGDVNPTTIRLTPYGKFLLEGDVNPYILVGLEITSSSFESGGTSTSSSSNSIGAAFGLEYFITENVGVFGQAAILRLDLDPSATIFGIFSGNAGVEWFFD